MAIFNSYVKLPEGTRQWGFTKVMGEVEVDPWEKLKSTHGIDLGCLGCLGSIWELRL